MYYPKCSFPRCYITSKELLIHIQQDGQEIFVCPEHLGGVGDYLSFREDWNSYELDISPIEKSDCCLCGANTETISITIPEETYHTTVLCQQHAYQLVAGSLSEDEVNRLKSAHSELHLLFAV